MLLSLRPVPVYHLKREVYLISLLVDKRLNSRKKHFQVICSGDPVEVDSVTLTANNPTVPKVGVDQAKNFRPTLGDADRNVALSGAEHRPLAVKEASYIGKGEHRMRSYRSKSRPSQANLCMVPTRLKPSILTH